MRIAVVSALARIERDGVRGYGGLERWAYWIAREFARREHEVLLFGNVDAGPMEDGVAWVHLDTESDVLSPKNYEQLRACDAVLDITHAKFARLARTKRYLAHTFWTDQQAYAGQNIYPSNAVREAFNDLGAPVVPIGIPFEGSHTDMPEPDPGHGYVSFGRIAHHKGHDLAVRLAAWRDPKVRLTVGGHIWPGIDEMYALAVAKMCRDSRFAYEPDPPNARADTLVRGPVGMIHVHRWLESFSIVAATALGHGVPVLTTDQGAVKEWVRATDGGVIVPLKALEAGEWEKSGAPAFFEERWGPRRQAIAKRARELFGIERVGERFLKMLGA